MSVEIQKLKTQRATLKGKITRILNYVQNFDSENQSISEITVRARELDDLLRKFEEVQDRIEELITTPEEKSLQETERSVMEERYYTIKSEINTLLYGPEPPSLLHHSSMHETTQTQATKPRVKLPPLEIPKFSGNIREWPAFKNVFTSAVDVVSVPKIQRLQYLQTSLTGEAKDLISSLLLTDDNYSKAMDILSKRKQYNRTQVEIESFFRALPKLASIGKNSINISGFNMITSILKSHYFSIETIMSELHQTCEDLLLFCSFNRKVGNCNNFFKLEKTYRGHCCAFNYAGVNDGSTEQSPNDVDYDEENEYRKEDNTYLTVTSESGRDSGLSVIFNVEPKDYPAWSEISYDGAKIILSDPYDYPEITTLNHFVTPGQTVDLKVEPMIFRSDSNLRRIHADKRGCLFHDEVILDHTDRYSFETCNSECKMLNYRITCGCIPYKYPKEKSVRTCELEDLACLLNMTVYGRKLICEPSCRKECNDQKYKMSAHVMPFSLEQFYNIKIKDVNISELSALNVYYSKSTCTCYKLSLLIDIDLFIATYGNILSLSFGGSLVTLFELAYLFLLSIILLPKNIGFISQND